MQAEFAPLEALLKGVSIPRRSSTSNRRGFPVGHRSMTFGLTKGRKDRVEGLSRPSVLYPEIFEEVVRVGELCCPFQFTSVHLNHNVVCPPHKDSRNNGVSTLVSFGDYTGGNIVIEGVIHDAKYNPITFDGSALMHWNTDDLVGNKYSLVFYIHQSQQ